MTNKSATGVPNIDRRELILGAIALVGGAGVVSCGGDAGEADDLSGELQYFDREQMRILATVVDILIPATDTPGARAARVHHFIDGMMAKWASAESRANCSGVLRAIDERAMRAIGRPFLDCTRGVQEMLVREIDAEAFSHAAAAAPFRDLKALVIAGFYSSELGASVELRYERVPGRYVACAPLADVGRAWAHR